MLKKILFIGVALIATVSYSQDKGSKKNTSILATFEPDLVISKEERKRLKEIRIAKVEQRVQAIDSMDISERKRQRLLLELKENPFSTKMNKAFADTKFEEESN